jgi:hypothetical protein
MGLRASFGGVDDHGLRDSDRVADWSFAVARFPKERRLAAEAKIAQNPHRPSLAELGSRISHFGRLHGEG